MYWFMGFCKPYVAMDVDSTVYLEQELQTLAKFVYKLPFLFLQRHLRASKIILLNKAANRSNENVDSQILAKKGTYRMHLFPWEQQSADLESI